MLLVFIVQNLSVYNFQTLLNRKPGPNRTKGEGMPIEMINEKC